MIGRPFLLQKRMYVGYEIKTGDKQATKSGKGSRPNRLDHLRVVRRVRSNTGLRNWEVENRVHDNNPKPRSLDIFFPSDDPAENFYLYRGWFPIELKGSVACRSDYGKDYALRRVSMIDTPKRPITLRGDSDDILGNVYEGGAVDRPFSLADEPRYFSCNKDCPIWQHGQCKTHGILHVYVQHEDFFELCRMRVNGVYAQMSLLGSINYALKISGGILAGIPFTLQLYEEPSSKPINGQYQTIPYLTIGLKGTSSEHQKRCIEQQAIRRKLGTKRVVGCLDMSMYRNEEEDNSDDDEIVFEQEDDKPNGVSDLAWEVNVATGGNPKDALGASSIEDILGE